MEFKDRIRTLRQEGSLSAAALAEKLGKSESAIRMWEAGKNKPDADTLIELSKLFECTTDYLLGLTDIKANDMEIRAICEQVGLSEIAVNVLMSTKITRKGTYVIDFLERIIEEVQQYESLFPVQGYLWSHISGLIEYIAGYDLPDMAKVGSRFQSDMEYMVPGAYFKIQQIFLEFIKNLVEESKQSEKLQKYEWENGIRIPLPPWWMRERMEEEREAPNGNHSQTQ